MDSSSMKLNSSQTVILNQFIDAIKDCELSDSSAEYLVKWLIIQDYDVGRAEKALRQSLEWRRVNGTDTILETYTTPVEVLDKYFNVANMGIDNFGCPVYALALGRMDIKGLLQCATKKEIRRHIIFTIEKVVAGIKEANQQTAKNIFQLSLILDLDQLSIRELIYKPAAETIVYFLRTFLINYPDISRRIFFINAPKIFPVFFSLIKPLFHPVEAIKIKVLTDVNEFAPALLEEIEADQLFACYGGSQTDPNGNPKCPSKYCIGGKVPQIYYLRNKKPIPKVYMETLNVIAGAGGRKKLKYKVDIPLTIIKWEFMSEGGDIGFRIYFKGSNGDVVDMIPLSRVDSHLVMEEGEIFCGQAGKYIVEFDNTFSYLRPKKLCYHIVVEPPKTSD